MTDETAPSVFGNTQFLLSVSQSPPPRSPPVEQFADQRVLGDHPVVSSPDARESIEHPMVMSTVEEQIQEAVRRELRSLEARVRALEEVKLPQVQHEAMEDVERRQPVPAEPPVTGYPPVNNLGVNNENDDPLDWNRSLESAKARLTALENNRILEAEERVQALQYMHQELYWAIEALHKAPLRLLPLIDEASNEAHDGNLDGMQDRLDTAWRQIRQLCDDFAGYTMPLYQDFSTFLDDERARLDHFRSIADGE